MANAAIIILFEEYLVFSSKLEIKGTYLIYFTYKTIHVAIELIILMFQCEVMAIDILYAKALAFLKR